MKSLQERERERTLEEIIQQDLINKLYISKHDY